MGSKGIVMTSHRVAQGENGEGLVKAVIVVLDPTCSVVVNPTLQSKNIATATIGYGSDKIGLASVYLEGDHPVEPYLLDIKRAVDGLGEAGTIIGGDFNASSWWGCDTEDGRGAEIVDMCSECNLNFLN